MKSITSWILASLAVMAVMLMAGCQQEVLSINQQLHTSQAASSTPPPEGFRAIAALEGSAEQKAERSVRTMSRADKIGQLMMIGVNGTTMDGLIRDQIHTYRVGGIMLTNDNMDTKQQVKDLTASFKSTADVASLAPLFVGVDRGTVKLKRDLMASFPTRPQLGRQSAESVRNYTTRMAIEMRDMGFNLNLGPTMNLDVYNSYTTDVDTMVTIGSAFAQSFRNNHIYVAYKYFPTGTDYGVVGVSVPITKESWLERDGAVFQGLFNDTKDHTPMLMVEAITIPDIDAQPVSLSKPILTDLVRDTMHYDGVIMSDKLETSAAVTRTPIGDYAVRTIVAGSDMVVLGNNPRQIQEVHSALVKAVDDGIISSDRLDASVRRIMYMKYRM